MSQSAGRNLSGGLTNVGRDLNITNTNSFNLGLVASAGSLSMTVGRDINISSGFLVGTTGSVSPSLSVAGNLNILGNGGFTLASNGSSTGTATMTVTGTGNISSTSGTALIVGASATKVATLTFTGLVTKTSSGTVSIGQGTAVSTLVANGGMTISSGTVNVSSGGSGGVLTIGSSATLTVNGGTLIGSATAHTSNINCNGNAVVSSGNMTLGNFAGGQSFFYLADNRSFTLSSPGTVNCAAAGNGNLQIGTISVTNPNASLILNGGDLVLANGGNGTINSYGDLYLNSGDTFQNLRNRNHYFEGPGGIYYNSQITNHNTGNSRCIRHNIHHLWNCRPKLFFGYIGI
jgi:fibronectin-binding autotransporter adhesin